MINLTLFTKYCEEGFNLIMPRNKVTKDEIKSFILHQKNNLNNECVEYNSKILANRYLNIILEKLEEYRF